VARRAETFECRRRVARARCMASLARPDSAGKPRHRRGLYLSLGYFLRVCGGVERCLYVGGRGLVGHLDVGEAFLDRSEGAAGVGGANGQEGRHRRELPAASREAHEAYWGA